MRRRQLPIGIQDFRTIREGDFYYVDKTPVLRDLVEQGSFYFLSRPRGFGKSLLVDTLCELFEGNEALFWGLAIHGRRDWSETHPVVRLSFGGVYTHATNLTDSVHAQLAILERNHGLKAAKGQTGPERLQHLLDRLHHATGRRVVVLVDDYDKSILDVLENPKLAQVNRDYLRRLYGIIRDSSRHVRFVLVTGVSMIAKRSLLPELNNLEDISLDPRFAAICGVTEAELDRVFAPELAGLDRAEIRRWYNGYNWLGAEPVYNPFAVLMLFRRRRFGPWWLEAGSPESLFPLLTQRRELPLELERRVADEQLISRFDIDDIGVEALLFQTGVLTITGEARVGPKTFYTLDFPNFEVRQSLNDGWLTWLGKPAMEAFTQGKALVDFLQANDFAGFADQLHAYLAGIRYPWQGAGGRYTEVLYANLLYMGLRSMGVEVRVEDMPGPRRVGMVILHGGQVFVLEFKQAEDGPETEEAMTGPADQAMERQASVLEFKRAEERPGTEEATNRPSRRDMERALDQAMGQMRARGTAESYRDRGGKVHLLAVAYRWVGPDRVEVRAEAA